MGTISTSKDTKEKKSVSQIYCENFINQIKETGVLPWQRPYSVGYSFNWFSMHVYTGINRWILPRGEYITMKQLKQYNAQNNTKYMIRKGCKSRLVYLAKQYTKRLYNTHEDYSQIISELSGKPMGTYYVNGAPYFVSEEGYISIVAKTLRFFSVFERHDVLDPCGTPLPSRYDLGDVVLTLEKPLDVCNAYISASNLEVTDTIDVPCYNSKLDKVYMRDISAFVSEYEYFSTFFHELAHSTGHGSRLNRKELLTYTGENYSKEECIAELCSALLQIDCGLDSDAEAFHRTQKNSKAYVQHWLSYFESNSKDITSIIYEAERAMKLIMGYTKIDSFDGKEMMNKL